MHLQPDPSSDVPDKELVAAALADPAAYAAIVHRYQAPLGRYLFRIGCRSRSDADDILQEVFLKAYRNLNEYDSSLKFSSWIYRIAHNEAVSFFRKASRVPRVAHSEDEILAFESLPDGHDLAEELDSSLGAAAIRDAIASLDAKYREVLVLRFLEDRTYEEISDILRKPPGTVATLISRAKAKLKAAVAQPKP